MPASWEIVKVVSESPGFGGSITSSTSPAPGVPESVKTQKKVAVIIPHTGSFSVEWIRAFKSMEKVTGGGDLFFAKGMPIDIARDMYARIAVERGYEWIFFLDSDVVLPPDGLEKLLQANLPIVNGMYVAKHPGGAFWDMWMRVRDPSGRETATPVIKWGDDRYFTECDLVGAGCMLIHRSVFEAIQAKYPKIPWFYWAYGRKPDAVVDGMGIPDPFMRGVSEDFWFCVLAKDCGYRIVIDTSIKCGHVGSTVLTEESVQRQNFEVMPGEMTRS